MKISEYKLNPIITKQYKIITAEQARKKLEENPSVDILHIKTDKTGEHAAIGTCVQDEKVKELFRAPIEGEVHLFIEITTTYSPGGEL